MLNHLKQHFGSRRTGGHGGLDIAWHIGPGLLVTVGFIDPGNWASNMAAGSQFGYALRCASSRCPRLCSSCCSTTRRTWVSPRAPALPRPRHVTSPLRRAYGARQRLSATIATAMAEVPAARLPFKCSLGAAPVRAGCVIVAAVSMAMPATNSYKHAERWIIAFVGVGRTLVFGRACTSQGRLAASRRNWITPSMPTGSAAIIECPGCGRYAPQPFSALRGHPIHALRRPRRAGYRSVCTTSSSTRSFRWAWAGQSTRPWSSPPQRPSRTAWS